MDQLDHAITDLCECEETCQDLREAMAELSRECTHHADMRCKLEDRNAELRGNIDTVGKAARFLAGELSTYAPYTTSHPQEVYDDAILAALEE